MPVQEPKSRNKVYVKPWTTTKLREFVIIELDKRSGSQERFPEFQRKCGDRFRVR